MKVFFRVDGGNVFSLGMGHIYRCLKLANYLRKKDTDAIFVMRDIPEGVKKIKENGYPVIRLPRRIDKKTEISILKKECSGGILVADVRRIDNNYFKILNTTCKTTVYFDDLGNNNLSPHVLINPSVTPELQKYRVKNRMTKYLIGEKYFILGDSGFKRKGNVNKKINNVLVSLGGADPACYTPRILRILDRLNHEFKIKVVLGIAYKHFKELKKALSGLKHKTEIFRNVSNMGELMQKADLAFVSGGDTCLELAFTGTPGILVPTIYYENITARYLEKRNIFLNCGDIKKISCFTVLKKIGLFWESYSLRNAFSGNAKRFIDGKGLSRVSSYLL